LFPIAYGIFTLPDETINMTFIDEDGDENTVGNLYLGMFGFTIIMVVLISMVFLDIIFDIHNMGKRRNYNS